EPAAPTRARGVPAIRTTAMPVGMARKNATTWTQPRSSGFAAPATALEISRPRTTTRLPRPGRQRAAPGRAGRLWDLMFESLSERFEGIFARLRSKGTLRESDVDEVLREIRLALLEADVNYVVVRSMLARIRERAVGTRVHEALNPSQQVVKLVNEALVEALGGETFRVQYASRPPTVVLMAGLQGSGKTTTSAKLARWFRQQGRNPLLVGADLQRPAAVEQARGLGRDVCIVDTAGRLAIDAEMMDQVRRISEATAPDYTFLVVDAMTGQDAVTVAESFDQALALDAVILTKLDGDARGGA